MKTEKRLIDANELDRKIVEMTKEPSYQHDGEDWLNGLVMAMEAVNESPTVDAMELAHGHWIDSYIVKKLQYDRYPTVKCSNCGCYFCDLINNHHFMYQYCPNCGTKMDG